MFGEAQVRTGHLVVGLLKTASLRNALLDISRQFERIKPDALTDEFAKIVAGSPEDGAAAPPTAPRSPRRGRRAARWRRRRWASRRRCSASRST